ncbi:MAG: potassium transporter TrkA, partial [Thiohalorhabdus sp.]
REVLGLITTPLLAQFLERAVEQDEDWANVLISRISAVTGEELPETWSLEIRPDTAPAVLEAIAGGERLYLRHLLTDPRQREEWLPAIPLLLCRGATEWLLPGLDTDLHAGDRILFCGRGALGAYMEWILTDPKVTAYVATGKDRPTGWLWQWLERRREARGG